MIKFFLGILICLFPTLALASDSLSFAPPPGDYSVVFLSNLFGVVDGVLHGTGSQIIGSMMGIFNAAILALGGIIIMYTLIVSTMNTAQEGQMLGQKWSSIWVPIRSTLGLALLIPKASGYCLMQIFVMWVIVQGVGAADKVWNAALGYLNRGGVIIQSQSNPTSGMTTSGAGTIYSGASTILAGQVCMLGLEQQLENQRQLYLSQKESQAGPCYGTADNPPAPNMQNFCNNAVPDFLSSVNAVTVQSSSTLPINSPGANNPPPYQVKMPNFDSTSPYYFLNGICGVISWNPFTSAEMGQVQGSSLGQNEMATAKMSRAIALQQMYVDLSTIAQVIVNNNPATQSNPQPSGSSTQNFSPIAVQEFGVPYMLNNTVCPSTANNCVSWGDAAGSSSAPLFNGTEFQGALADYNGIMLPTLNLYKQAQQQAQTQAAKAFIQNASSQGWLMAGSYFFNIVALNAMTGGPALVDANSGLDQSAFNITALTAPFSGSGSCTGPQALLCQWFGGNPQKLEAVLGMIDGSTLGNPIPAPNLSQGVSNLTVIDGTPSATVYGFVNNSMMVQLPNQPGTAPLNFANNITVGINPGVTKLQPQNFQCGEVTIMFFKFCLGRMFGDLFYNVIFLYVYNIFMVLFGQVLKQVLMAFLIIPLQGAAEIFKHGLDVLDQPGVNPIVALANMGTYYINFAGNMWISMIDLTLTSAIIPIFGLFIFGIILMGAPVIMAWLSIMVIIGFITAYYIPLVPYMIFTFGSLAWFISVIEAMVSAPLMALGITHPEGHEALGKGEAGLMLLMNVFLRPSMMVIGLIAGIALSFVGVWVLNAGYDQAVAFIQKDNPASGGGVANACTAIAQAATGTSTGTIGDCNTTINKEQWSQFTGAGTTETSGQWWSNLKSGQAQPAGSQPTSGTGGYSDWAGIFAFFFSILTYTTMYLIIVQKSFTLIAILPDRVLRWIGGAEEKSGQEAAQWSDEAKQKIDQNAPTTAKTMAAVGQKAEGIVNEQINKGKEAVSKIGGGGGGVDIEGQ